MKLQKLTETQVVKIWEDIQNSKNENLREIASKYNVSLSTVRRIKNRSYKIYDEIINNYMQHKIDKIMISKAKRSTLSPKDIYTIWRKVHIEKEDIATLANKYNVSLTTIKRIRDQKTKIAKDSIRYYLNNPDAYNS